MFVVDAYIGNFDRHNGNWGLLVKDNNVRIAPVYDCGSSLFPQIDIETMKKVLVTKQEMNTRIYNYPTSQLKIDNKKINYYDFLMNTYNKNVLTSIKKISSLIIDNENKINNIIEDNDLLTTLQKEFYTKMLMNRKEKIIVPAYERACELLNEYEDELEDENLCL